MELELSGKTAAVTGAPRGIGLAIVQALLDEGVTVIGAAPGPPDTQTQLARGENFRFTGTAPSEVRAGAEAAIPTGRFTQPSGVARLVLVLASSTFGNITGADFVIDGGMRPTV